MTTIATPLGKSTSKISGHKTTTAEFFHSFPPFFFLLSSFYFAPITVFGAAAFVRHLQRLWSGRERRGDVGGQTGQTNFAHQCTFRALRTIAALVER